MSKVLINESTLTSIANAIREKTNSNGTIAPSDMGAAILGATILEVEEKDINFVDYDGTLLYSYTFSEFINLTELPPNPTHYGLTAQGWNWTLADAKVEANLHKKMDIGQMYTTSDGRSRFYINIPSEDLLKITFGICPDGDIEVNWGDGSSSVEVTGTSADTGYLMEHTYPAIGKYVITVSVTSGRFGIRGAQTTTHGTWLLCNPLGTPFLGEPYKNDAWSNLLYKVELGTGVSLRVSAFLRCTSLETITISNTTNCIGASVFQSATKLKYIVCPNTWTSILNKFIYYGLSLKGVSIPKVTAIADQAFYQTPFKRVFIPEGASVTSQAFYAMSAAMGGPYTECYLASTATTIPGYIYFNCKKSSVTISSIITSIENYGLANLYCLDELHMLPQNPPTLGTNALKNFPTTAIIYVPYSSDHSILNTYKTTEGWSTFAEQMQEESQS